MELLPAFLFCAAVLCSNAQSPPSVASADCNGTEKEAGVALDLINKHRRDGYVFSLLRVADAHVQHVGNASIFYFTLDVLESECPVISRKHWETCGFGPFFGTSDFGRCHAVIDINRPLQRERLYGYNCTMSPVPPKLYECKDCPVRIIALENVQQYAAEAERVLERYNQDSNQTRHFKVDQVTKVLLGVADRSVYYVEFTIKEATCPKEKPLSSMSGCQFLPDREAHTGFCVGKVVNGTKDLEGTEVDSCEIYDVQLRRPPSHGLEDDSGECHPNCSACGHGCQDPGHRHHHHHHHHPDRHHSCHPHHHHPPPPPHHHPHHHRHHSHHHHHRPHDHHRHRHCHGHRPCGSTVPAVPSNSSAKNHHRHRHPPHDHHKHKHCHGHRPCGSAEPAVPSNSSKESEEKDYPGFPPPPGPQYPPPPPGGPHHFPPSQFPPPPAGPPPPPGPPFWPPRHHHHHHHHPEGPDFRPSPCGSRHGHRRQRNDTLQEKGKDASSKDHDPFRTPHPLLEGKVAAVNRIPLASEHDVLQAPGKDFVSPSHNRSEKAVAEPFPLTPSGSGSCPGKPTFELPLDLLSLYPPLH